MVTVVLDFADSVVLMAQGKVRLSGKPKQVRDKIEAAYLGGARR